MAEDKISSSPALARDIVYFGSADRRVDAVDVKTGLARWTFETEGAVYSSPSLAGGMLYFGSADILYTLWT